MDTGSNLIPKKLIFHFYSNDENVDSEINKIHLSCLKYYINLFSSIVFVISVDDTNNLQLIHKIETYIIDIVKTQNITFKIIKNSPLRECDTFKTEIVDKINDNIELVFFAHNKGLTNITSNNVNEIYTWVLAMYFYNLNFISEVENQLLSNSYLTYGAFLTVYDKELIHLCKYNWVYPGTFYWMNVNKMLTHCKDYNETFPKYHDRYFAEQFPGRFIKFAPNYLVGSHKNAFLCNCMDYYNHTTNYLNLLYDDISDYKSFESMILGYRI